MGSMSLNLWDSCRAESGIKGIRNVTSKRNYRNLLLFNYRELMAVEDINRLGFKDLNSETNSKESSAKS